MSKEKETIRFVDYTKDIAGAIGAVKRDGEKLKHKIHNVALSIIRAWGKGDVKDQLPATYFNQLADAAGYHGKALAQWIAIKTPLVYSDETNEWYVPADAKKPNGDTFVAARDEPFWAVSPPAQAKPFDGIALLNALLERNTKKATKGAGAEDKLLTPAQVKAIRSAIGCGPTTALA